MAKKIIVPDRSGLITFSFLIIQYVCGLFLGVGLSRLFKAPIIIIILSAILFPICFKISSKLWLLVELVYELLDGPRKNWQKVKKLFFKLKRSIKTGEFNEEEKFVGQGGWTVPLCHFLIPAVFAFFMSFFCGGKPYLLAPLAFAISGVIYGCILLKLIYLGYLDPWDDPEDPIFDTENSKKNLDDLKSKSKNK